jgi:hypothetical protein
VRALLPALIALLATLAAPVAARGTPPEASPVTPLVTSSGPDKVAVTIYRAPDRGRDEAMQTWWLRGYALVTERRRIVVPAGQSIVRFEGVAAGILAESAIITGLPQGVREKNLDAALLSPASLFGRAFGRPVTVARKQGKREIEEPAIIRSGPNGAAIVQTKAGFEGVDCGLGARAIVYDGVPAGLSAKPTLSVAIDVSAGATLDLTLSYLAWGFDWQANYVATLRPDGNTADLVAWVTLASGDVTSFADAETMVVAGKVNREDSSPYPNRSNEAPLVLHCVVTEPQFWSPLPDPREVAERLQDMPLSVTVMSRAAAAPAPPVMDVVVTARRVSQEDLGDLKLYRAPAPTTVAPMAQKQIALLDKPAVPVDVFYRVELNGDAPGTVRTTLRAQNKMTSGLGLPLPAGPVAVFTPRDGTSLLIGEGHVDDKAVGEEVEIDVADATQVTVEKIEPVAHGKDLDCGLIVRNANPQSVRFEAVFNVAPGRIARPSQRLVRREGRMRMPVSVPANGSVTLRYRLRNRED